MINSVKMRQLRVESSMEDKLKWELGMLAQNKGKYEN